MKLIPSEIQIGQIKVPIGAFIFFDADEDPFDENEEEEEEQPFAM